MSLPGLARAHGFGLIELMVALALGLILILGVTQIVIGAKQSFVLQQHTSTMQENARFLLNRMARELRMVDLYGCLDLNRLPASVAASVPSAFAQPIGYSAGTLSILTAVPHARRFPTATTLDASDFGARWLIATDCRNAADLRIGTDDVPVRPGDVLIPVRQVEYSVHSHAVRARLNGIGNRETLIDGAVSLDVSFGLAATVEEPHVSGVYLATLDPADFSRIRSVRLALQLSDNAGDPGAAHARAQTYTLVVALRNRSN